jgi:uncharacterized protein
MAAADLGIRVICVRIGIVLAPDGGALARMLAPFRMGVGGRLGGGRQSMPWVHIKDVAGMMLHASGNERISGPMNAVAPCPVTNLDFTRALAHAVHRPAVLPVPRTALRIAFGEFSDVLIASQRVVSARGRTKRLCVRPSQPQQRAQRLDDRNVAARRVSLTMSRTYRLEQSQFIPRPLPRWPRSPSPAGQSFAHRRSSQPRFQHRPIALNPRCSDSGKRLAPRFAYRL